MNERIKQLCEQAKAYATESTKHLIGHLFWMDYYTEKFAESIVNECISMADDFECDVNQRGLVDRMKQHFGVEE